MAFELANLPPVSSLSVALRAFEKEIVQVSTAILKMDKTGHWVYGADQTEVDDEATWAINPFSFVQGFIAWGDGEVLGEKMVPVSEPLPELEPAPAGAKKGWEAQVGLSLKCLTGSDKDLEARFTTTSVGGKRAVQTLAVAIAEQVEKDQSTPVPVIRLKKDHYQHKSYGRIFTPVFEIVEWIGMDGAASNGAEPEAVEAAPARRRRA
jgi:hypothetical protein